jgi:predicted Zn-dependent protease
LARAGTGPEAEATRTRLRQARRHYGLATPGAVPPDAEPGYTQTFDQLAHAMGEGAAVNVELQAALARHPGAPGLIVLSCEVQLRAGRRRQAEKLCASALQAAPEMARGHYLLGILTLDAGRRGDGETHLKRAIELDPDERNAWQALGDVYRMAGKRADLAALAEQYRKRFNARLP